MFQIPPPEELAKMTEDQRACVALQIKKQLDAELPTQGARANQSGSVAEALIETVLLRNRIPFVRQFAAGRSIYGHPMRVDFWVPSGYLSPSNLIIESKWQDAPGSNDEKLPYLVKNILETYPYPAVVVYGGVGWKPGALRWLQSQVDGERLLFALSIEQFTRWCTRRDRKAV